MKSPYCFYEKDPNEGESEKVAGRSRIMSSHPTNPQLPFDVLGRVFSYYSEEEMILYPLETLLLVCRSWSQAALGHRALWSRLRMLIEHEPSTSIWRTRLPLRLARCGPEVPLDIVLHNLLESRLDSEISLDSFADAIPGKDEKFNSCPTGWKGSNELCSCYAAASAFIRSSLVLLAGDRGELCRRWRSLKLLTGEWPREMQDMSGMDEALRYPTPILTTLVLKGLSFPSSSHFTCQLFPDAPVLKKATVLDCDIQPTLNLGNAADLEMGITNLRNLRDHIMHAPIFNLGTSIQRLSLWMVNRAVIQIPPQLPNLRVFELVIDLQVLPSSLFTCEMPQLTSLSLNIAVFSTLHDLLRCRGINLSRLKELTLDLKFIGGAEIMSLSSSNPVVKLLEQAHSLEHLYACEYSLTVVLEILVNAQDTEASRLPRGAGLVNLGTKETITLDVAISHFRLHGSQGLW